jgi:RND family efflux transporter MFP subunit
MGFLFTKKFNWYVFAAILIAALGITTALYVHRKNNNEVETGTVSQGSVSMTSTVSGKIESKFLTKLGFPVVGTVKYIYKSEGDMVREGEIIASLAQDSRLAEYNTALQNLRFYESQKEELLKGPEISELDVTTTQVQIAKENLNRTEREQARLVQNVLEVLLSSDLEAVPLVKTNDDTPPLISGTYACQAQGDYEMSIYRAGSESGIAYRLSGLENGTYIGFTDTPAPMGECGLSIRFDSNEAYRSSDWIISIPNTQSNSYLSNLNAYKLALDQKENAVSAAEQALELALNIEKRSNAAPTVEELIQANANLGKARAGVAAQEAAIADYTIKAPFNGVISSIDLKVGELANANKGIHLIQDGSYELKARIPEVDIRKVRLGNKAIITFDASPKEKLSGTVEFISPQSEEINGVSYYEGRIKLDIVPEWIREGLSADVDILIEEKLNTLRLPWQFIKEEDGGPYVLLKKEDKLVKIPVELGIYGNNGFVEVKNLKEGTVVVAP